MLIEYVYVDWSVSVFVYEMQVIEVIYVVVGDEQVVDVGEVVVIVEFCFE